MSEKSFAIVSISAAIVCGTFFYPPPPAETLQVPVVERQADAPLAVKTPGPGPTRVNAPSEQRAVEQLAKLSSVATPTLQGWGRPLQAGK